MPSFTRSATIDRAPATVFAVLDDLSQAPKIMPAIKKIEILTPGQPMGVGFKWRETRRIFGIFPIKIPLTVTGHDAPRHWRVSYNDGKVEMSATFDLKKEGAGTHITLHEELEPLTMSPKRVERMFKGIEKDEGDLLDRLKAHVESTKPVESSPKATGAKSAAKKAAKKSAKKAR